MQLAEGFFRISLKCHSKNGTMMQEWRALFPLLLLFGIETIPGSMTQGVTILKQAWMSGAENESDDKLTIKRDEFCQVTTLLSSDSSVYWREEAH